MQANCYGGHFIAIDGPNGVGKSTLIERISSDLRQNGIDVVLTKEPTGSALGIFTRQESENIEHNSLACLVAADRYDHLDNVIIPHLKKGHVVISDRYVLSSLVLQRMDDVEIGFIMSLNQNIVLPDLQIVVIADPDTIHERLAGRQTLSRFERGNRAVQELLFLENGVEILTELGVKTITIDNSDNLNTNVSMLVNKILEVIK